MRSRLPAVLAASLFLLLVPATAGARSLSADDLSRIQTLAYWTPARIAAAKPLDYVKTGGGFQPAARPGGGGGGGTGAVTGASWGGTTADTIRNRSGRILFHQGTGDWICSGSVVTDGSATSGYSTILTAGHCVYDGADGWATKWVFMPDFDEGPVYNDCMNTKYGCWTATRLAANSTFVNGGGFGTNETVAVDYGFARVGLGGKTATGTVDLDGLVGAYPLKTTTTALNVQQWAFGYPAEGRYKGKDLTYCTNGGGTSLINDPNGADTWGMACNMNGGSSGGPWITGGTNPSSATGWSASSVNSYGYSGLTYMFGPKFNSQTTSVLGAVATGSGSNATTHNIP